MDFLLMKIVIQNKGSSKPFNLFNNKFGNRDNSNKINYQSLNDQFSQDCPACYRKTLTSSSKKLTLNLIHNVVISISCNSLMDKRNGKIHAKIHYRKETIDVNYLLSNSCFNIMGEKNICFNMINFLA